MALIFGPKADFEKAVAENRTIKARTGDPEGRDWSATLPVPADAPAKLVVTARFTTGVGLTAFKSDEVAVIDPPKPEDMKPAAAKLGAITGTVKEGDRPQPGLRVYLLDPMAAQPRIRSWPRTPTRRGRFPSRISSRRRIGSIA